MGVKHPAADKGSTSRRSAREMSTIFLAEPNTDCTSQDAIGLVVPGDPAFRGMTQTYYKRLLPHRYFLDPGNSARPAFGQAGTFL